MALLEMPSQMYSRENRTVCWGINTEERINSPPMSPEENKSCSEKPCDLQRLDMKFPSSKSNVSLSTAQEELRKKAS